MQVVLFRDTCTHAYTYYMTVIRFHTTWISLIWQYLLLKLLGMLRMLQFVVGLGDKVSPTDIEEGMRVG